MIFIEIISCIVLSYNVNCVGNIITKIRSYDLEQQKNLKVFNQFNEKTSLSDDLSMRINNYIR